MNAEQKNLIEGIHSSGWKSVWVVTGGGITAVQRILSHPGASRFVLDVRIPYSREALAEFLGENPAFACSEETARKMAQAAFNHASNVTSHALGIACTAVLQTNSEQNQTHRAFICIQSLKKTVCERVDLGPDERGKQDACLSVALLSILSKFGSSTV
ncbi:CinA family protein [Pontiellaceae bacterium B1224]|nr:CinA family protein [Pontiellaceae bacterium B1224]